MKKIIFFFLVVISSITLLGCAPTIQSVKGNHRSIYVELDKKPSKPLELMSSSGLVTKAEDSHSSQIVFHLPKSSQQANECLYVVDKDGKTLSNLQGNSGFRNTLWSRYNSLKNEISADEKRLKENKRLFHQHNYVDNRQNCPLLTSIKAPTKPEDACAPDEEEPVAKLICGVSALGAEFCSMEAKEIPLPFRGAACSGGVSLALQQEYSIDTALRDAFIGLIDGIADEALKTDSLLQNIFGIYVRGVTTVAKFAIFNECVQDKKELCRQKYHGWQKESKNIRTLPKRLQNAFSEQELEKQEVA
ncbi:MAG: hypothetical protein DRR16_11580 [Candidatus Parabeggiatoa sp. nov. 3]|nr:MAG: hypothetical protein DRR00_20110 [Gammaproteobacteria bacterium]RKZ62113.1 MAG: hypothetical protein DRQ99_19310 [Gammaproteobacteria bacterium]RKZ85635.1 MAG: hypothetical protein DRR16_11580 [Gammaproteobacteria bacterium]HEW97383.1 hypothetical protein [Beggiatoa sp.]